MLIKNPKTEIRNKAEGRISEIDREWKSQTDEMPGYNISATPFRLVANSFQVFAFEFGSDFEMRI
jgi:hypothetical protein